MGAPVTPMLDLLSQARRSGVRIDTISGRLTFTGPDHLVRELETHREHIAYWLREGRVLLDWRRRSTIHHPTGCVLCCDIRDKNGRHPKTCTNCLYYRGRRPDPCALCHRTAHLVEDGRPVHKDCAERYVWRLLQELLDNTDRHQQGEADRIVRDLLRDLQQTHHAVALDGGLMTPRRVKVAGDLFHGRVPDGAVYVGRSAPGLPASPLHNPHPISKPCKRCGGTVHNLAESRLLFLAYLRDRPDLLTMITTDLPGRDLACWCRLDSPWCHADDLLILANGRQAA